MASKKEGWEIRWRGVAASIRFSHAGTRYEPGIGRHALPTGERDYKSAKNAAALKYAEIVSGRFIARRTSARPNLAVALKAAIEIWLDEVEPGYDKETIKSWKIYGRKWVAFFENSWVKIHDQGIHTYAFRRLKMVLRETVLKELSALRNFLTWCNKPKKWIAEVPNFPVLPTRATGIRSGTQRAQPVPVTEEQIENFIAQCPEWSGRDIPGKTAICGERVL